ncbi:unnamed protein product, partial [Staurois parvus]
VVAFCPRSLPSGRLPPVARDPCSGVDCPPVAQISNPLSSHGGSSAEAPS